MPVQTGHDLPQSTVYGSFSAQDGYLVIAAQMTDTWKSLAPLLGQHNREIAESVGYSASDIDAMEQGGVLYSEKQS